MDLQTKMRLERLGMDVPATLERFLGNEKMLIKFLKKFQADDNMEKLSLALSKGDVQTAYEAAHVLKGISANLALGNLNEVVAKQSDLLKHDHLKQATTLLPEAQSAYDEAKRIIDILK
ncbi:Hpt domain-containing protein [Lachnospiraceae bacterium XBB1006]|nr:Hpt domain-containing protein [Lachnospiraceae bacterium XBB1006]